MWQQPFAMPCYIRCMKDRTDMLQEYIYHGKEKLRCGYTTGSCATAATKAATRMLLSGEPVDEIELLTPKGILLKLQVHDIVMEKDFVSCAILKDSGDDADCTNGILVYAKVSKIESGIYIDGGEGIGVVTKKGLDQPVGNKAINHVPREMMTRAIYEVMDEFDYENGISVVISVPQGEKIAEKTFNKRMGIEGGISIIGTSGIVEPMSQRALVDTIRLEERMKKEEGKKYLLASLGNYSETFLANEMPGVLDQCVKCSNFIKDAIEIAKEMDFQGMLIVGHVGKLVKLGSGIMNTHSAYADGRMETLITCGVLAGAPIETLKKLADCVTVDAALAILDEAGWMKQTLQVLMDRIHSYLLNAAKGEIRLGVILFSNRYGILGQTEYAKELLEKIEMES